MLGGNQLVKLNPYSHITESKIGKHHKNKNGYEAEVIGITDKRSKSGNVIFKCRFVESGYEFEAEYRALKTGHFKDYGRPTVYGVGYSYKGAKTKDNFIYKTWSHMLERCYNKKFHAYNRYGGSGVKVDNRWIYYKNFEEDVKILKSYEKFIERPDLYSLDKDILGNGKLYSKNTCMFATVKEQSYAQQRTKGVIAIDIHGNEIDFPSVSSCSKELGVPNANIYKVLNGERKQASGYFFKRKSE